MMCVCASLKRIEVGEVRAQHVRNLEVCLKTAYIPSILLHLNAETRQGLFRGESGVQVFMRTNQYVVE